MGRARSMGGTNSVRGRSQAHASTARNDAAITDTRFEGGALGQLLTQVASPRQSARGARPKLRRRRWDAARRSGWDARPVAVGVASRRLSLAVAIDVESLSEDVQRWAATPLSGFTVGPERARSSSSVTRMPRPLTLLAALMSDHPRQSLRRLPTKRRTCVGRCSMTPSGASPRFESPLCAEWLVASPHSEEPRSRRPLPLAPAHRPDRPKVRVGGANDCDPALQPHVRRLFSHLTPRRRSCPTTRGTDAGALRYSRSPTPHSERGRTGCAAPARIYRST